MPEIKILVTDDDVSICQILNKILTGENYHVYEAHSGKEALQIATSENFDLILLDLQMPDLSGIEVAQKLIAEHPQIPIILISAYGTISKAVEATKVGVYDFLEKPPDRDRILVTVRNALSHGQLQKELVRYKQDYLDRFKMVGQSEKMRDVFELIDKIGPTESSVLIMGENGSGKELVAQAIHFSSGRKERSLVRMNCAAVPDNLLESELFGHTKGAFTGAYFAKKGRVQAADGGTLFLDEIGDMSPSAQAKVLRFLESGEIQRVGSTETATVDVRVIAATNKEITEMVEDKSFREDLYYRLNVFSITVPPLRERKEDIPILLDYFIKKCADANGISRARFSPSAMNYLRGFEWPGNVRQVRNFVDRLMVMKEGDLIDLGAVRQLLSPNQNGQTTLPDSTRSLQNARQEFERDYILNVLEANKWRVTKAAEILGVDRANLYRKMRQLGINGK